jgi:hypothetical protein
VSTDSTADTLLHSLRVGQAMAQMMHELMDRSYVHDWSKTQPPEKDAFDAATEGLHGLTYGSSAYYAALEALGPAREHHYRVNRHHPEHFADGVAGMTLMDLIEMLADWEAARQRHDDGDLARSLVEQRRRFGLEPQLYAVLVNTARHLGWIDAEACRDD